MAIWATRSDSPRPVSADVKRRIPTKEQLFAGLQEAAANNPYAFSGMGAFGDRLVESAGEPNTLSEWARVYRRPITRRLNPPLEAAMQAEAARQIALRGPIDPALEDAIASSPELQTIREAFVVAEELEKTRADIAIYAAGGRAIDTPSDTEAALSGAIQGASVGAGVGGPAGAIVGGIVGGIGGLVGNKGSDDVKGEVEKKAAGATNAISPAAFGAQLGSLAPTMREQAMISGDVSASQSAVQAALSRSGMRDSALGTLTGVAAAALPEQAGRGMALSTSLTNIRRKVENILGTPVRTSTDRTAQALGALTEGYLLYKQLLPAFQKPPKLGSPQELNPLFSDAPSPYFEPAPTVR